MRPVAMGARRCGVRLAKPVAMGARRCGVRLARVADL